MPSWIARVTMVYLWELQGHAYGLGEKTLANCVSRLPHLFQSCLDESFLCIHRQCREDATGLEPENLGMTGGTVMLPVGFCLLAAWLRKTTCHSLSLCMEGYRQVPWSPWTLHRFFPWFWEFTRRGLWQGPTFPKRTCSMQGMGICK